MIDPEQKRQAIQKVATWGLIAVGCAIAGPLAYLALEGLVAIVAFGVSVALVANFAPAFGQWLANKRIAALKAVIAANPIETMQDLYKEKLVEFKHQEDAVTEFDTQFRNVSDMVEKLRLTDPEEAGQYVEMRDRMHEGLSELRDEQRAAQAELGNAKKAIDKMERLWAVGCAMNKALSTQASAQKQFFDQMKQDVAVETVQTNLNRAFANLNTAVERRKNNALFAAATPKSLPEAKPEIIDLGRVGSKVKVNG